MTKVIKNTKGDDMRMHIQESFVFLDKHLPEQYVARTLEFLNEMEVNNITAGTIRNVRLKGPEKCNNLPVLTALLKVAKENEKIVKNFNKTFSEIQNS